MYHTFITIIIGAFTGFSSGLFGIAGANITTPMLQLFINLSPILALATPLAAGLPSAISGSYIYKKENLIDFKTASFVLLTAVPFGLLGSWTTKYVDSMLLVEGNVLLLVILGLKFFLSGMFKKNEEKAERKTITGSLASGAFGGYIAGILAIGGGPIFVTSFAMVNHMPMKKAIATSLFCVCIVSLINTIAQLRLGHIHLQTALILTLSVIPFSYLGAKTSLHMKNKTIEKAFGALMIFFALYFIYAQYH